MHVSNVEFVVTGCKPTTVRLLSSDVIEFSTHGHLIQGETVNI